MPLFTGDCPFHKKCSLDFFCNDHFTLCCSSCRKEGECHHKCNVVSYDSVDLNVVQTFLSKVTKKLEKELAKIASVCIKGLTERQTELVKEIQQAKEAVNAYFHALEVRKDGLIKELDDMIEDNEFTNLIRELKETEVKHTNTLIHGRRTIAEWDIKRGKEMVQRASDILSETRELAAKTKQAESTIKYRLHVSFLSASAEPTLGKIVSNRTEHVNVLKHNENNNKKYSYPLIEKLPLNRVSSYSQPPDSPMTTTLPASLSPRYRMDALIKSRINYSLKSLTTPSPSSSPPPPTPQIAEIMRRKSSSKKSSKKPLSPLTPVLPIITLEQCGMSDNVLNNSEIAHDSDLFLSSSPLKKIGQLKFYGVLNNSVFIENLPDEINKVSLSAVFSSVNITKIRIFENGSDEDSDDGDNDNNYDDDGECRGYCRHCCGCPCRCYDDDNYVAKCAIVTLDTHSDVKTFVKSYGECEINENVIKVTRIPSNSVIIAGPLGVPLAESFRELFGGSVSSFLADNYGVVTFDSEKAAEEMLVHAKEIIVECMDIPVEPCTGSPPHNGSDDDDDENDDDDDSDDDSDDDENDNERDSIVMRNVPNNITKDEIKRIFEGINVVEIKADSVSDNKYVLNWTVKFDTSIDIRDIMKIINDTTVIKSY